MSETHQLGSIIVRCPNHLTWHLSMWKRAQGELSHPSKATHYHLLCPQPQFFSHYPGLVRVGTKILTPLSTALYIFNTPLKLPAANPQQYNSKGRNNKEMLVAAPVVFKLLGPRQNNVPIRLSGHTYIHTCAKYSLYATWYLVSFSINPFDCVVGWRHFFNHLALFFSAFLASF